MITIAKQTAMKKWLQWNVENIIMTIVKHLELNLMTALNNPKGVDVPLN